MNKSEELRKNADNCTELARATENAPEKKRFERMAEGWNSVANTQDWLDGEPNKPSEPILADANLTQDSDIR